VTLAWRTSQGVVMGQWRYRRGDEMHTVDVKPRVVSDDRDSTIELAVRGAGVVRVGDLVAWTHLRNGTLEPALTDWEGLDAPPVRLLYRRNTAASARVRAFAAFVDDVFRRLKAERRAAGYDEPQPEPTPEWFLRLNRHPPAKAPARPKA
jgi:LysR family transcriptional regulator, regulator for bpeEF and oprC